MSNKDDEKTAFDASDDTPGQAESRTAFQRFQDKVNAQAQDGAPAQDGAQAKRGAYSWYGEYLKLRARGYTWRKAVYIAWASMPTDRRRPSTKHALAVDILGLKSARAIRRWEAKDPSIHQAILSQQAALMFDYRADLFQAIGEIATQRRESSHGFQDRKLALKLLGDLDETQKVEVTEATSAESGDIEAIVASLDDDELAQMLANLELIAEQDRAEQARLDAKM